MGVLECLTCVKELVPSNFRGMTKIITTTYSLETTSNKMISKIPKIFLMYKIDLLLYLLDQIYLRDKNHLAVLCNKNPTLEHHNIKQQIL